MMTVATRAGVSVATVSNTINNTRHVDADTRARVESAIRELDYLPSARGRLLRTGRTNSVAIFSSMPPEIAAGASKLGFSMEIAASAAVSAMEFNIALVLAAPTADPSSILRTIDIDGAIVVEPPADDPYLAILQKHDIPLICIGEPPNTNLPFVELHYTASAHLLVDHMAAMGATCFPLIVGDSERRSYAAMVQTYQEFASQRGFEPIIRRVAESTGEDGAAKAVGALLDSHPSIDGLLVPVDAFASGALSAVERRGRKVPDDILLATRYDGIRARQSQLTAVNLHLEQVAGMAVQRLAATITGAELNTPPTPPKPTLVQRRSSCRLVR